MCRERKELFRWNKKTFFIVFKGLSVGEKINILSKIPGTSFKLLIIYEKFKSFFAYLSAPENLETCIHVGFEYLNALNTLEVPSLDNI